MTPERRRGVTAKRSSWPAQLLRRLWGRALMVAIGLAALDALLAANLLSHAAARDAALGALQGSMLLFTIGSTLAIALFSSYAAGLKDAYTRQVGRVRDMLVDIIDEHDDSSDPGMQELADALFRPLIELSGREWESYYPVQEITSAFNPDDLPSAMDFLKRNPWFAYTRLLRLEDELNELGMLLIRRAISPIQANLLAGAIILVVCAIAALTVGQLLPHAAWSDYLAINVSVAVIGLGMLHLLFTLSMLRQQAREEVPPTPEPDEDSGRDSEEKPSVNDDQST